MNEIEIDLSKCIDNFKIDKDKAKQYGGYKKIANDLSKENMKLAFENTILQAKIDKAIEYINKHCVNEKISKEVGYKCYTMADTNELEKIINILGGDK